MPRRNFIRPSYPDNVPGSILRLVEKDSICPRHVHMFAEAACAYVDKKGDYGLGQLVKKFESRVVGRLNDENRTKEGALNDAEVKAIFPEIFGVSK